MMLLDEEEDDDEIRNALASAPPGPANPAASSVSTKDSEKAREKERESEAPPAYEDIEYNSGIKHGLVEASSTQVASHAIDIDSVDHKTDNKDEHVNNHADEHNNNHENKTSQTETVTLKTFFVKSDKNEHNENMNENEHKQLQSTPTPSPAKPRVKAPVRAIVDLSTRVQRHFLVLHEALDVLIDLPFGLCALVVWLTWWRKDCFIAQWRAVDDTDPGIGSY